MRDLPIRKLIAAVIVLTVVTSVIMLIPNWNGEEASTARTYLSSGRLRMQPPFRAR